MKLVLLETVPKELFENKESKIMKLVLLETVLNELLENKESLKKNEDVKVMAKIN